jgi:hypothetical protein
MASEFGVAFIGMLPRKTIIETLTRRQKFGKRLGISSVSDFESAREVFKNSKFEPGTGFVVDLVHYPDTAAGVTNVALRTYRNVFNPLSEKQRLIITEQISSAIQNIRATGVNCILEVWDAPGNPGGVCN